MGKPGYTSKCSLLVLTMPNNIWFKLALTIPRTIEIQNPGAQVMKHCRTLGFTAAALGLATSLSASPQPKSAACRWGAAKGSGNGQKNGETLLNAWCWFMPTRLHLSQVELRCKLKVGETNVLLGAWAQQKELTGLSLFSQVVKKPLTPHGKTLFFTCLDSMHRLFRSLLIAMTKH